MKTLMANKTISKEQVQLLNNVAHLPNGMNPNLNMRTVSQIPSGQFSQSSIRMAPQRVGTYPQTISETEKKLVNSLNFGKSIAQKYNDSQNSENNKNSIQPNNSQRQLPKRGHK